MQNKLLNLNVASKELYNILVKDMFFEENISLCNMGGYPFLTFSSGSVTYTSEVNTYFSPSAMFLAKHHQELHTTVKAVMQLIQELKNLYIEKGWHFDNEYHAHLTKAVSGDVHNAYNDLTTEDELDIMFYQDSPSYYEEKTSYDHPYCISAMNFKKMENENDYKGLFSAAMFAKSLYGHFDFLMYAVHGGESFIARTMKSLTEKELDEFLLNYYFDNMTKRVNKLLELVKEENQKHEELISKK